MDDRQLHIDLDLRLSGEDVEGCASMAGAAPREFSGWVGLLAALDALTATTPEPAEPR
jgi:hypothetical protein